MTLYRVMDDEVVAALSPSDLVDKLVATSMSPVPDKQAFRDRAAMWARELYGKTIRTNSDDAFVDDMLREQLWSIEVPQ